jgi:hypothetical protein
MVGRAAERALGRMLTLFLLGTTAAWWRCKLGVTADMTTVTTTMTTTAAAVGIAVGEVDGAGG